MLLGKKVITQPQLNQALAEQRSSKEPLGQVLVRLGFLKESDLRVFLSEQLGVSFLSEEQLKARTDQRLKEYVPKDFAMLNVVLPIEISGRVLKIAVAKMPDLIFLDNLRKLTGMDIQLVLSNEAELRKAIDIFYGSTDLQEVVSSAELDLATHEFGEAKEETKADLETTISVAEQAPVVKLVDVMIKKALDDRASDIHIEPFREKITVRYRIDGELYELPPPPKELHNAVISRIKILGKMDIAEKRVPQDGSFSVEYKKRKIDIRVSSIPIIYGEKIVMRVLDKRTDLLDMKMLGFEPEQQALFETALMRPYGLIFVTGPTGSGKSTTLYAALNKLLSPTINIVTVEDPVEYQITGISQVNVKPDIGLTFASGLRAFLRQDPDVMLVGEVRDLETAEICIRAALTGHLVLSTLHTNDAVTAVTRLVDIGIQPYLVAGSLALVAAQRLIRVLCPHCKEPYPVDPKLKEQYHLTSDTIYKAKGCKECRDIGYWGRAAIYEVLPIDEDFRHLISKNADLDTYRELQKQKKYETLYHNGLKKVDQGMTSLEEALSVAYE